MNVEPMKNAKQKKDRYACCRLERIFAKKLPNAMARKPKGKK